MAESAGVVAERAAREAYGKLVAFLAARSGDLAGAEDALADAFCAALETWPRDGVPANPEGWLYSVARRRQIDAARRRATQAAAAPELERAALDAERAPPEATLPGADPAFPDDRLKLLFVCAHPAIDAVARTPLMLQAVLGFDAARIAAAFLASPDAMAKRLVRAKAKIREARIPFEAPEPEALPARLADVLDAIYAAFTLGANDAAGHAPSNGELADEALWLARLLAEELPGEPEALGLLALLLHVEARRDARRGADGSYVPLLEQDVSRWNGEFVAAAERALHAASTHGQHGRYQLEAAIQSAHASRARTGAAPWDGILQLYALLRAYFPSVGAAVGHAAACVESGRATAALEILDELRVEAVQTYQPYWAVRARTLAALGRHGVADDAYERAIGLCSDAAARAFLIDARARSAAAARGDS